MDPTKVQKFITLSKQIAIALVLTAGTLQTLATTDGIHLPTWLLTVAHGILGIGVALGIGSSGLKPVQPQTPEALSAPAPAEEKQP